jgi:uncharacterized protein
MSGPRPVSAIAVAAVVAQPVEQPGCTTRPLWLVAGWLCLLTGTVGIVMPLVPTADFYGLAAICFARGSRRWERWLLNHRWFGGVVREWRACGSVPREAKWLASASMSLSSLWALIALPAPLAFLPAAFCLPLLAWLWWQPERGRSTPAPVSAAPLSAPDRSPHPQG